MIRSLNSIHSQAHVPKTNAEKKSFAGYSLVWCEFTHHHHEGVVTSPLSLLTCQEEIFFFPECEKRAPGSMQENVEQHKAFMAGLEAMETYFNSVRRNPAIYDGNKVTSIIEQFGDVFVLHLREEIDTLAPEKLRKIWPVAKELEDSHVAMMKWIVKSSGKFTMMPWVCYLTEWG